VEGGYVRLLASPRAVIVAIACVILLIAAVVSIAPWESPSTQDTAVTTSPGATSETTQEAAPKPARTTPRDGWTIKDLGRTVYWDFERDHYLDLGTFPPTISELGQAVFSLSTITAARYEHGKVVRLPNLPGGTASSPAAINDNGQIVGWASTRGGDTHAVLWSHGGVIDLGTLGGASSTATAINERGQVAGYADTGAMLEWGGPVVHAFLWENGDLRDLTPGRHRHLTLTGLWLDRVAINERGQVIGEENAHAFLWERGQLRRLARRESEAVAINNIGQVVGWALSGMRTSAFVWQSGRARKLGTLGGEQSQPTAINDSGQVVGQSGTRSGRQHAFLWQDGKMTDLGALPGAERSKAYAINSRGQVVGWSITNGRKRAVLWEGDRVIDLGTLGGADSAATDINDRGEIVGLSTTANGEQHAVLWTLER
jgi:probable HAF family extracellular repeat protein